MVSPTLSIQTSPVLVVESDAHEGPVYVPEEDALYFTTVPRELAPGFPETQIPATGASETVVDAWCGLRFNSPNDVVVANDGALWFTDPSYGYFQGFRPPPVLGDYVYRYAASAGGVQVFSPEGRLLGEIELPGAVNFTFGGRENNVLFITADTAIWAAVLDTKGA